jgi:hypothetical protein
MDCYEQNITLLKKYREPLYDCMQKALQKEDRVYPCDEILTGQAKDGSTIFTVSRQGQTVRLNSPYRPAQEAQRWASQFSGDNILVNAMLFGFGNGMFPQALLECLRQDAKLFICEPSLDIFEKALQEMDLSTLLSDERVFFFFEDVNPNEFYNVIRQNTHWTSLATQIVCHHTGYETLFPEAYRDFLVSVKKTGQSSRVNRDTQSYFAKKMVPNMIKNMAYIKDSRIITDYIGKMPQDIPAIVVAAGPSLDKNIDELKRAKGKAFILAVDTAMRHLLKHGIVPDAMATVDAAKPFEYMNDPALKDIPLFCMLESNHEIMEFHTGLKIWFQGELFLENLVKRYDKEFPIYRPGGSVATAAFSICAALRFERIVLVGQDLAYQGNLTHAGGEKNAILNEETGIQMVEGIDGQLVKSRSDWLIYLDWFEEAISTVKEESDTEVIDATEGGAMIHGSRIMKLSEVIDQYCTRSVDISQILHAQPALFTPEEYRKVREEIQSYSRELRDMEREASQAAADCREALKKLARNQTADKKMAKIEKRVLEAISHINEYCVYSIVDIYMSSVVNQYLEGVFVVSEDEHQDKVGVYKSSRGIFLGISEAAGELIPMFEEVLPRL